MEEHLEKKIIFKFKISIFLIKICTEFYLTSIRLYK